MVKTLILPGDELGYIQVQELIIFADNKALLLYSYLDGENDDSLAWQYFNPENGKLIGDNDGMD